MCLSEKDSVLDDGPYCCFPADAWRDPCRLLSLSGIMKSATKSIGNHWPVPADTKWQVSHIHPAQTHTVVAPLSAWFPRASRESSDSCSCRLLSPVTRSLLWPAGLTTVELTSGSWYLADPLAARRYPRVWAGIPTATCEEMLLRHTA